MSHIHEKVIHAIRFAAERHSGQRRKGVQMAPYINHPIQVVSLLVQFREYDEEVLSAAALHDVIEDTVGDKEEAEELSGIIEKAFGPRVLKIVREVSDDKSLPSPERKQIQIDETPALSEAAKKIKIADKICNILDLTQDPPVGWSAKRKRRYLEWAARVVDGARGVNTEMEQWFDARLKEAIEQIG